LNVNSGVGLLGSVPNSTKNNQFTNPIMGLTSGVHNKF